MRLKGQWYFLRAYEPTPVGYYPLEDVQEIVSARPLTRAEDALRNCGCSDETCRLVSRQRAVLDPGDSPLSARKIDRELKAL